MDTQLYPYGPIAIPRHNLMSWCWSTCKTITSQQAALVQQMAAVAREGLPRAALVFTKTGTVLWRHLR